MGVSQAKHPTLKDGLATALLTVIMLVSIHADFLHSQSGRGRVISIHNIHTKETLTVEYKKNGKYIPSAMKRINHIMRDWRRNESRVMRKDLIDLMWEMHTQLGSKKPIYLISGYRSLATNNKLRKTRGGQARRSRHILGMAADVHFPDIPIRELRDNALIRQKGGVGYYPTSGLPFVHMDVGRVRHWPRLARPALAQLFPNGRSKHIPRDGRPLTKADARKYGAKSYVAKLRRIQLARRLQRDRNPEIAIASLNPADKAKIAGKPGTKLDRDALLKRLAALEKSNTEPRLKQREKKILAAIDKNNQQKDQQKNDDAPWWRGQTIAGLEPSHTKLEEEHAFVQLASIDTSMPKAWQSFEAPKKAKVIDKANVAYSPGVDDEHPEELNYRPFPLGPLMTDIAVAEDQKLAKLSPPDYAETSVILKENAIFESARFRPGLQNAHLKWANRFSGYALPFKK